MDYITNIIHPTDFSEPAQNAFNYAIEIAHTSDANLTVLHASKSSYNYGSEQMIGEILNDIPYADLRVDTSIELGDTVSGILSTPGDLIVMGTKGKTNLKKTLFGSISSDIMLKSGVPVLLVPDGKTYSGFTRLVFATDYNDRDLEVLDQLTAWAQLFEAEITVLHVTANDSLRSRATFRGFKELALEHVEYPQIDFKLLFEKDFYTGISAYLHGYEDELLVMSRYKKPFFQSLIRKSHLQQTPYSKVPLLVIPADDNVEEDE